MNPVGPSAHDAGRPSLPWGRITLWFLASHVLIFVLGWGSTYVIQQGPAARSQNWLPLLLRWDSGWYLNVAQNGYRPGSTGFFSPNFFPLYPLLIRLAHFLFHDYRLAALVVSNACTLGASLLFWRLVRQDETDEKVADRATLFFLFNPVAVFYAAAYTEGLFLLLFLGLAQFAKQRQWLRAGACGYCLTLSRPVGIVAVVLLAAEFLGPHLKRVRRPQSDSLWPDSQAPAFLVGLLLTVAGVGTYSLWLDLRYGDPLLFLHAAQHWRHHFSSPWTSFIQPVFGMFYRRWFQACIVAALILLGLGFFLRVRLPYLVITAVYLLVYLSTGNMEAIPRYLSVLFPFYIVLARATTRWPRAEPVVFAGSVALMMFSTILFVNGYWFT